jgi:hypothetical protein
MPMTIKVVFIKQGKKEIKGTVYVRTIEHSITTRRSLSIHVTESQWDNYFNTTTERFRKNKNFPLSESYNNTIDTYLRDLNKVGNDIQLLPDNKKSFISYWNTYISTTDNHGTSIKHKVVLSKLKKYLTSIRKKDLFFIDITPLFVRELRMYLTRSKDPKTLSNNSVNHYLKVIKSIINHAQTDEYYKYVHNPFASLDDCL